MAGWLIYGWLNDWLIDFYLRNNWLIWWVDWFMANWMIKWLTDWPICVDQLTDWLKCMNERWTYSYTKWLTDNKWTNERTASVYLPVCLPFRVSVCPVCPSMPHTIYLSHLSVHPFIYQCTFYSFSLQVIVRWKSGRSAVKWREVMTSITALTSYTSVPSSSYHFLSSFLPLCLLAFIPL